MRQAGRRGRPLVRPPDPPLRDGDVLLRPFRQSDAAAIAAACQDPEIQHWVPLPAPYTIRDATDFVTSTERGWRDGVRAEFAIVHAGSGDLLGAIGIGPGGLGQGWSIGYWVAPDARRLGVASRALRLVSRWALGLEGVRRVYLIAEAGNVASQQVAVRAGFHRDGLLRAYLSMRGELQDVALFSLLPRDLAAEAEERRTRADVAPPGAAGTGAPTPTHLVAPGSADRPFEPVLALAELPPGSLRRVSRGDLDVLLAHTPAGIVATEDRCPHMAAPISLGTLDGCVVSCPLHRGRFDLCTGETVQMPTTGGLDADGVYHPTWAAPGSEPKPDPPGPKAEARRLTRVRRFRYYPVRVHDGRIEVALPEA